MGRRFFSLLIPLLLFVLLGYAGGPDIERMARQSSVKGEFFGGGGVGMSEGPYGVPVNQSQFPASANSGSEAFNSDFVRFTFELMQKANLAYMGVLGYNFDPYVGMFFDYLNWGSQQLVSINGFVPFNIAPGLSGSLSSYSFGPGFIGYWPIDQGLFDFFGTIGVEFVTTSFSFTVGKCSPSLTCNTGFNTGSYSVKGSNQAALAYGMGGQVNIGKYFSIRLEYKALTRLNNNVIGNISYNAYLFGMLLRYSL